MKTENEIRRRFGLVNQESNEAEMCKKCKGTKCCQHFPCIYAPTDFKVLREEQYTHEQRLKFFKEYIRILENVSIDMVCLKDLKYGPLNHKSLTPDIDKISKGDGFLFLRARVAGRKIVDFQYFMDENHYYPCCNWSYENGCKLTHEERPYTGRLTIPLCDSKSCKDFTDYNELFAEWKKYSILMYDLYVICRDFDK